MISISAHPTTLLQASEDTSIYRCVIAIEECRASACTSRNDPPTKEIFLAQEVIAVLRPE